MLYERATGQAPSHRYHWRYDPSGVRVAFTGRLGGVSAGPFASLNLGALTDDQPGLAGADGYADEPGAYRRRDGQHIELAILADRENAVRAQVPAAQTGAVPGAATVRAGGERAAVAGELLQ